jgi:hypothetical protein
LQRVKPSASRSESKEIYFLGHGYEESKEPQAVEMRRRLQRLENARSQEEADRILGEMLQEGKGTIQEMIQEVLKQGHDLPDELRDKLKQSDLMRDLNIEQKMSLREKQKARKKAEDNEERIFYE